MSTKPPAPVQVTNPDPIPVVVEVSKDPLPVVMHSTDTPAQAAAKTVAASARVDADILLTEDQRRISGLWERTQQIIALSVVEVALFTILLLVWRMDVDNTPTALAILFGLANLVIGFYFGRTNHSRVGGEASRDA